MAPDLTVPVSRRARQGPLGSWPLAAYLLILQRVARRGPGRTDRLGGAAHARQVTLGRSDGQKIEVKQGLKPGERYAASNSFILKSELGKASAEHKH